MSKVDRFEELDCWKVSRELVKLVYQSCLEGKLSKDFETRGQIKRAALSTMNNIAEGFGRQSKKEFIRFLDFSQSSAMEVRSITYALEDMDHLPLKDILVIREKAEATKSLTRGLLRAIQSSIR